MEPTITQSIIFNWKSWLYTKIYEIELYRPFTGENCNSEKSRVPRLRTVRKVNSVLFNAFNSERIKLEPILEPQYRCPGNILVLFFPKHYIAVYMLQMKLTNDLIIVVVKEVTMGRHGDKNRDAFAFDVFFYNAVNCT